MATPALLQTTSPRKAEVSASPDKPPSPPGVSLSLDKALEVIAALNDRLLKVTGQNARLMLEKHEQTKDLEFQLIESGRSLDDLSSERDNLRQKCQPLLARIQSQSERIHSLEQDRDLQTQLIERLREEIDALSQGLAVERERVQKLTHQLKDAVEKNNQLLVQLQQQQQQILANQQQAARVAAAVNRKKQSSGVFDIVQQALSNVISVTGITQYRSWTWT